MVKEWIYEPGWGRTTQVGFPTPLGANNLILEPHASILAHVLMNEVNVLSRLIQFRWITTS